MTRLHDLYSHEGQSPWIDDLKRSYITEKGLDHLVELGIRGVTSNPTIMAKAIEAGSDYDEQFEDLVHSKSSVADAYWDLVLFDAEGALKVLQPTYRSSGGRDGFVSVEVLPDLAHDAKATAAAALALHRRVNKENLLVKIPATKEGLSAIEEVTAAGKSVNVTLIFSLARYEAVIDAYLSGLETFIAHGGNPSPVSSVASFFVSRVDTEIDRRLDALAADEHDENRKQHILSLRGKAAVAQARLAYGIFSRRFNDPRANALKERGAQVQRPLWASTSTKNPSYDDLLYVEELIGPQTVNTMPASTIDAFIDHGSLARRVDAPDVDPQSILDSLGEVGVELDEVTDQLEVEGVSSFAASFDELTERLTKKAASLHS